MSLPLATTTITVLRPDSDAEPYEGGPEPDVVAKGVPAVISSPSGSERAIGGQQSQVNAILLADTIAIEHTDLIVDEHLGDQYRIEWVRHRPGLGLDHTKAGLIQFEGASVG